MRLISALLTIFAVISVLYAKPAAVDSIDAWLNEIADMMDEYHLVQRRITYTHGTIPGIGMPGNVITGYFDQIYIEENGDFQLVEIPLLIVNDYSHAGYEATESFYYHRDGELVCCVSTMYGESAAISDYTDRLYFSEGETIYCVSSTGDSAIVPGGESAAMAQSRLSNSRILMALFCDIIVPSPGVFWEKWPEFP